MDRRTFLWRSGGGLGGIALTHLLAADGLLGAASSKADLNGGLHHRAKEDRRDMVVRAVVVLVGGDDEQAVVGDSPRKIGVDNVRFQPVVGLLNGAVMHVVGLVRHHI